jgi:hypothetical protein
MGLHQTARLAAGVALLPILLWGWPFADDSVAEVSISFAEEQGSLSVDGLGVVVKALQPQVEIGTECELRLTLVNTGDRPTKFRMMSSSWYQHWRTDSAFVLIEGGWSTTRNSPVDVTLPPGGRADLVRGLRVLLTDALVPGPVWLRLGFTPLGADLATWSDRVRIVAVAPRGRADPAALFGLWLFGSPGGASAVPEGDRVPQLRWLEFRPPNHFSWAEEGTGPRAAVVSGFYYLKGSELFRATLWNDGTYTLGRNATECHGDRLVLHGMRDQGVVLRRAQDQGRDE